GEKNKGGERPSFECLGWHLVSYAAKALRGRLIGMRFPPRRALSVRLISYPSWMNTPPAWRLGPASAAISTTAQSTRAPAATKSRSARRQAYGRELAAQTTTSVASAADAATSESLAPSTGGASSTIRSNVRPRADSPFST